MVEKLNKLQLQEFKEAFDLFDRDKSGTIDINELALVLKALGQTPNDFDITKLMIDVDVQGNRTVNWEEFLDLMVLKISNY